MDFYKLPQDNENKNSNYNGYNQSSFNFNPNNYNNQFNTPQNNEAKNDYEKYKRKLKSVLVSFLLIALVVNVCIGVFFVMNYKSSIKELENALTKKIEAEIGRETHLPNDYYSPAQYVTQKNLKSVVEIIATTGNTGSKGSGFVINNTGLIVTNAHVVRKTEGINTTNHTNITANFYKEDKKYTMKILQVDDALDLAVLQFIQEKPTVIKPVVLINSDILMMGEDVVVLGNAQGLGISATQGVLSAESYILEGVEVLRADAPINPGNSGGPMFNALGECIGVASFKIVVNEANEGLGFGITSNELMKFLDKKNIKYEKVAL